MLRLALAVTVLLSACQKDETISGYADPDAVYALQEINGAMFTARATIQFPAPGKITGQAPCNSYSAGQTVPYPWIKIEDVLATRRACPDLDAETVYFQALQSMTLAEISGVILILSNDSEEALVFEAE